eukprot:2702685-Prymnesium_polylepis.1
MTAASPTPAAPMTPAAPSPPAPLVSRRGLAPAGGCPCTGWPPRRRCACPPAPPGCTTCRRSAVSPAAQRHRALSARETYTDRGAARLRAPARGH